MIYRVVLREKATKRAEKVYLYYASINPSLGDRFLATLQHAFESLATHPASFGFIDKRKILRDILLKKFPYTVIYKIDYDEVVVVNIHHCSQHPKKRYR